MVVGADGQNHGWFEAGRQLLLQRPWRGPPAKAKLDSRIMSLVRTHTHTHIGRFPCSPFPSIPPAGLSCVLFSSAFLPSCVTC